MVYVGVVIISFAYLFLLFFVPSWVVIFIRFFHSAGLSFLSHSFMNTKQSQYLVRMYPNSTRAGPYLLESNQHCGSQIV